MRRLIPSLYAAVLAATLLAAAPPLAAQTRDRPTAEQLRASFQAHKGDFDYLLGDWTFTGENRQYGKLRGYWSATRLDGGQILDEYRVVGDKGETYYVTSTVRAYNAALDRWELIGMDGDGGGGLQDFGTGQRVGGEVRIEQKFGVATSHPSRWRIRYSDIRPDRFTWTADRSLDDGKSWTRDFQKLQARRIGPARALGPLTTAKESAAAAPEPDSGKTRSP